MEKEPVLLSSAFCPDTKKRFTVNNEIPTGISKEVCDWITAKKNTCLINLSAGASLSKIHTYIRQLRVVVITLRAKLDNINEEIKSLSKFREGIATCLDQLDSELRSRKADAVIKRPRFIKNHEREAKVNIWQRNGDSVRMSRSQMFAAQKKLQQEFTTVRDQLQKLSKTRSRMTNTILERSRVLTLHAEMVAAGHRGRHNMQEHEKTQTMLGNLTSWEGLEKYRFKPSALNERVPISQTNKPINKNKSEIKLRPAFETGKPPQRSKSAGPRRQKMVIERKIPDRSSYKPVKAWENTKYDVMNLPPAYTSQCHDVIQSVSELNKSTRGLKRQVFAAVEDSLLVPTPSVQPPVRYSYGGFYGVACGGKCPRKNGLFFK